MVRNFKHLKPVRALKLTVAMKGLILAQNSYLLCHEARSTYKSTTGQAVTVNIRAVLPRG